MRPKKRKSRNIPGVSAASASATAAKTNTANGFDNKSYVANVNKSLATVRSALDCLSQESKSHDPSGGYLTVRPIAQYKTLIHHRNNFLFQIISFSINYN